MNIQCVLCTNDIQKIADRYILENSTKSGVEARRLLENLPFEVNLTPYLGAKQYVCKRCLRELKKRDGLLRNLNCCEEQLGFNTRKRKRKGSSCESVSADEREGSNDSSTPSTKGHAPRKLYFELSPISTAAESTGKKSTQVTAKSTSTTTNTRSLSTNVAEQPHYGVRVSDILSN